MLIEKRYAQQNKTKTNLINEKIYLSRKEIKYQNHSTKSVSRTLGPETVLASDVKIYVPFHSQPATTS